MPHGIDTKLSPAANGTQDFTKAGIGTPKGYLVFNSEGIVVNAIHANYSTNIGGSDFAGEGASSSNAEDDVSPSVAAKIAANDGVVRVGEFGDFFSPTERAQNNGVVTDGIQLDWTLTNNQKLISALMFSEGISDFDVQQVEMNGVGDTIITTGFDADLVMVFNCNAQSTGLFNTDAFQNVTFYDVANDAYASSFQLCTDNRTDNVCQESLANDKILLESNYLNGNLFNNFTLGAFTATGFTASKISSTNVRMLLFVSFKLDANYSVRAGFVQAPGSTGVVDLVTGLTGIPQLAMFMGNNQLTILDSPADQLRGTAFIGACTESDQFAIAQHAETKTGVSNVGGAHHTDRCIQHYDELGVLVNSGEFAEFKNGAVSINFTTSNAVNQIGYMVISTDVALADPVISSPTDTELGSTTSEGTVVSDEASGNVYGVVTQSPTTPSHAQIVNGLDEFGATADASEIVNATVGVNTLNFQGLTAFTSYFTHFTQENSQGGEATPISADGFTTVGNTAPVVVSPIPDQVAQIGVLFTYDTSPHFTDPDGDVLVFTDSGLPNGLAVNPNTGVVSGIPTGGFA